MATKTILGLSANTRMIAFAIIRGKTLEHYHTSLHKGAWNSEKKDQILSRLRSLLAVYTISEIALALPYENHSTEHIESLLESFTTYFNSQNIPVCSYYPEAFHLFCEEGQPKTKKVLMESISRLYPELQRVYQREVRNKNKYYIRLFESVALATIHSQCLNQPK
jgi:hypothetical protein